MATLKDGEKEDSFSKPEELPAGAIPLPLKAYALVRLPPPHAEVVDRAATQRPFLVKICCGDVALEPRPSARRGDLKV